MLVRFLGRIVFVASVALVPGLAAAQDGGFSLSAFQASPGAYIGGRYPADAYGRELRADLQAQGFSCRDAYPVEAGTLSVCERMAQSSRHCFVHERIAIRADRNADIARAPRCMGVLPPPQRSAH
ncbi:MAG: hypothetical protein AB7L65_11120 [Hyphomonadaceae bacterium]